MKLDELLVIDDLQAMDKENVLLELSTLAASQSERLSPDRAYSALMERELHGCTGIGRGMAIPHSKIEGVDELIFVLARSHRGVHYGAQDKRPVQIFVVLLGQPGNNRAYVEALGKLGRLLRDEDNKAMLLAAKQTKEFSAVFFRMWQSV